MHPITKKQCTRPHGPPGNAYLVVWKVGVTHTYANENEEQHKGFAGKILKEYTYIHTNTPGGPSL